MPEFIKKKSPSKTKKIIISTSLLLLLITVLGIGGYIGYKYYLDYQQKKDLRAVIQKFKELELSPSVGRRALKCRRGDQNTNLIWLSLLILCQKFRKKNRAGSSRKYF